MRTRSLCALLAALSIGLVGSTQSQNSDTLQALKDSLSSDQQGSILQQVLGKGGASGKKTDEKLDSPETVRRKNAEQQGLFDKEKYQKTLDGRILRQFDEDPELRANDTVLIELVSLDELCNDSVNPNFNQPGDQLNNNAANRRNAPGGTNPLTALNTLNGVAGNAAGAGANGLRGVNGNVPNTDFANTRCRVTEIPKTDLEKEKTERFRKRVRPRRDSARIRISRNML
jgi:hypothetical protein